MELTVSELVRHFKRYYREYTETSLRKALTAIRRRKIKVGATILDYYMKPRAYGGLGYGKRKRK